MTSLAETGIKIKPENKGKFTSYCGGKVTEECIRKGKNSSDPDVRKRATFAENARKWKHQEGGTLTKLKKEIKSALSPSPEEQASKDARFKKVYPDYQTYVKEMKVTNPTGILDEVQWAKNNNNRKIYNNLLINSYDKDQQNSGDSIAFIGLTNNGQTGEARYTTVDRLRQYANWGDPRFSFRERGLLEFTEGGQGKLELENVSKELDRNNQTQPSNETKIRTFKGVVRSKPLDGSRKDALNYFNDSGKSTKIWIPNGIQGQRFYQLMRAWGMNDYMQQELRDSIKERGIETPLLFKTLKRK